MPNNTAPVLSLQRIRLELARTAEFPEGSRDHGYEFVAPITTDGHIDPQEWKKVKQFCRVSRFAGQDVQNGMLRHVGHGWRFDYDGHGPEDDEPFFKLDRHALTPGAYVSITEHDGVMRPFKVIAVTPA